MPSIIIPIILTALIVLAWLWIGVRISTYVMNRVFIEDGLPPLDRDDPSDVVVAAFLGLMWPIVLGLVVGGFMAKRLMPK